MAVKKDVIMSRTGQPLYSFEDSRELDRRTVQKGFSEMQLMGQAAFASMCRLRESFLEESVRDGGKIYILCGSGNNGGDGLALAYHLMSWDKTIFNEKNIFLFRTSPSKSDTSRFYETLVTELNLEIHEIEKFNSILCCKNDTIVECLLGTGQKSGISGIMLETLRHIGKQRSKKKAPRLISLDVPAGVSESESIYSSSQKSLFSLPDEIHTYGADKICLNVHPEICTSSAKYVLPAGFYPDDEKHTVFSLNDIEDFSPFIKKPLSNKYLAGYGISIGGSAGMEGAISLACESFFAAGGGILNCITSERTKALLLKINRSVMFHTFDRLLELKIPGAVAVGPGLSKNDLNEFSEFLFSFLNRIADAERVP